MSRQLRLPPAPRCRWLCGFCRSALCYQEVLGKSRGRLNRGVLFDIYWFSFSCSFVFQMMCLVSELRGRRTALQYSPAASALVYLPQRDRILRTPHLLPWLRFTMRRISEGGFQRPTFQRDTLAACCVGTPPITLAPRWKRGVKGGAANSWRPCLLSSGTNQTVTARLHLISPLHLSDTIFLR